MDQSSRRKFLATCLSAIAAAGGGATLYPVYRYLAPRKLHENGIKVSFPASDIPPGGAKFFALNGEAGVVIRKKGGELAAFSAVCTHLVCILQWENEKQEFICPCHGGRFNAAGGGNLRPPSPPGYKTLLFDSQRHHHHRLTHA